MSPPTQLQKGFTLDTAKTKGFILVIGKNKRFHFKHAKNKSFHFRVSKNKSFHLGTSRYSKNKKRNKNKSFECLRFDQINQAILAPYCIADKAIGCFFVAGKSKHAKEHQTKLFQISYFSK